MTLLTNGPANPTVKLKGIASGVGTATRLLEFGTILAYTTAVLPLTITNFDVPGTVTIGTAINGIGFKILTTAQNTCIAGSRPHTIYMGCIRQAFVPIKQRVNYLVTCKSWV